MKVSEILDFIHTMAPPELAEDFDNVGLLIGDAEGKVEGVLTTVDINEEVIRECLSLNYNVILCHHPLIFRGIKKLTESEAVSKLIRQLIKEDIHVIACHTNIDNILINGVNDMIAEKIGLKETEILKQKGDNPETGSGIIGYLENPLPPEKFLQKLKSLFNTEVLRHTSPISSEIEKVALCGGSGSFLISDAKKVNADIFLTADVKYHQFFDAEGELFLVDMGHYEIEQYTKQLFSRLLNENFSNFAARYSNINTNPVKYFK